MQQGQQDYQQPLGQGSYQQQPNPYAGNNRAQYQNTNEFGTGGGSFAVSDDVLPF